MSAPSFRLVAAQVADGLTFAAYWWLFPARVSYAEQNPLVLGMFALGGVGLVIAVKVGIGAFMAVLYERVRKRPRISRRNHWNMAAITVLMSIGAAVGIAGAGFNLASILFNI